MLIDRRRFLGSSCAALTGAMTLGMGSAPGTAHAIPPIGRTRPSHLKLSLAAYSYRQYLTGPKATMDLFAFADLAADLGLDAIEPTSYYFPTDVDDAYLTRLRRHSFLLGLDISGTAVGNDFCVVPGTKRDQEIAQLKTWIDRASRLNAPVIRVFAGRTPKGETDDKSVERAVEGFKEVLSHAGSRGVFLALENHGGITATPKQMLKIVEAVDSPWFGVNLDTGNFHTDDPYRDLEAIAPYAVNVQVKTEIDRGDGKGKVPADLSRIFEILRKAHYSGYVALEYEADEDPLKAIPRIIPEFRKLMNG